METTRNKIPKLLEFRLKKFYGGKKCVVTGESDGTGINIHWAHLDENPSHTTFDNIVPLSSGFNLAQESWRRNREAGKNWFDRTIDLKANYLFFRMQQHFRHGSPALAYGCSRLGQILSMKYPREFESDVSDVWAFLCQSLYYLPYKMEYDLLESVLIELNKYLTINSSCPCDLQAGLLLVLANIYQDGGLWRESDEIYKRIEEIINLPPKILAAANRRRALSSIFSYTSEINPEYAFDKAFELNDDFDFQTSISIARSWNSLINQSPKDVLFKLKEFDEIFTNPKGALYEKLNLHNIFEMSFTKSAALLKLGKSYKDQIALVEELSNQAPFTRLRPVFTNHISKLTFDDRINEHIAKLSTVLFFTPRLTSLLEDTTKKLLIIRPTSKSIRQPWVH